MIKLTMIIISAILFGLLILALWEIFSFISLLFNLSLKKLLSYFVWLKYKFLQLKNLVYTNIYFLFSHIKFLYLTSLLAKFQKAYIYYVLFNMLISIIGHITGNFSIDPDIFLLNLTDESLDGVATMFEKYEGLYNQLEADRVNNSSKTSSGVEADRVNNSSKTSSGVEENNSSDQENNSPDQENNSSDQENNNSNQENNNSNQENNNSGQENNNSGQENNNSGQENNNSGQENNNSGQENNNSGENSNNLESNQSDSDSNSDHDPENESITSDTPMQDNGENMQRDEHFYPPGHADRSEFPRPELIAENRNLENSHDVIGLMRNKMVSEEWITWKSMELAAGDSSNSQQITAEIEKLTDDINDIAPRIAHFTTRTDTTQCIINYDNHPDIVAWNGNNNTPIPAELRIRVQIEIGIDTT